MHLVEVIGDTQLPKPAKGAMRIHKVENINKVPFRARGLSACPKKPGCSPRVDGTLQCLKFIKEKGVNLVSIGAEGAPARRVPPSPLVTHPSRFGLAQRLSTTT